MKINFSKEAHKDIQKLDLKIRKQLKVRIELFMQDPDAAQLRRHKLSGRYKDCYSINITGEHRLIYEYCSEDEILVLAIGTHSQLYG
jgi:addiction module RelE/StbE family toxin